MRSKAKVTRDLRKLVEERKQDRDWEHLHSQVDEYLVELLEELGYDNIRREIEKMTLW